MSIFTRIFVFLVMILAVIAAILTMVYTKNQDNYKQKYRQELARRAVAELNEGGRELDLQTRIQEQVGQIESRDAIIRTLNSDKDTLLSSINALNITIAEEKAKNDASEARFTQLTTTNQRLSGTNTALSNEIKQRRANELRLEKKNAELVTTLRDRDTQVDTYDAQVRLLQDQVKDQEARIEELTEKLAKAPKPSDSSTQVAVQPKVLIQGQVTSVTKINKEVFIAINVGRNDKVTKGTRFVIHKGDVYLGTAEIMEVDDNTSAGRVIIEQGQIAQGASVLSGGLP